MLPHFSMRHLAVSLSLVLMLLAAQVGTGLCGVRCATAGAGSAGPPAAAMAMIDHACCHPAPASGHAPVCHRVGGIGAALPGTVIQPAQQAPSGIAVAVAHPFWAPNRLLREALARVDRPPAPVRAAAAPLRI